MDEKKLQEKIRFTPFKEQQDVIDTNAREVVLCAGRRFGKSAVVAYIALKTLIQREKEIAEYKKTQKGEPPKPAHIWIVSPTYDLSDKVFRYLVKWFLYIFPSQRSGITNRPYPQIKTANGSWVQCKSAENEKQLLGEELDLLIMDEAAFVKPQIYDEYLSATLTSREGKVIFISTPFGQNWFYRKFLEAKEDNAAFQFPSHVNPNFHPKHDKCKEECTEWERLQTKLPEQVFNQWYAATFNPDAASVFRGVEDIIDDECLQESQPGERYTMGVDLGKHEDFTVLTVINRRTKRVVFWDRFRKIDYPLQKARIASTAREYNDAKIIVDSTGLGQSIKDDLVREGLFVEDMVFWNNFKSSKKGSKKDLIDKLSIFIQQKKIRIPEIEVLRDELNVFGYELTDSGNVKYSAPIGYHDDAVISLALAVWGLDDRDPEPFKKNLLEQVHEMEDRKKLKMGVNHKQLI